MWFRDNGGLWQGVKEIRKRYNRSDRQKAKKQLRKGAEAEPVQPRGTCALGPLVGAGGIRNDPAVRPGRRASVTRRGGVPIRCTPGLRDHGRSGRKDGYATCIRGFNHT